MSAARQIRFELAAALLLCSFALGQDLVSIAPQNAKVEYEDTRIRVVRLTMAAHQTLPMHDRPSRLVIPLTVNHVKLTSPDGNSRVINVPAGQIAWSEPTRRSVETLDEPFENVIVEIKNAKEPARPVTHPPSAQDERALIEPSHHWIFENQWVRVYDVHDPPGNTGEFHAHAYDAVMVRLSPGLIAEELPGQSWSKAAKQDAGVVSYSADAKQPRVHRVRNDGPSEFHSVVVQLK